MKIDEAIACVRPHLTEERFNHTLRVAETAVDLAAIYNEPIYLTELAAIFHDYAKYRPMEEMKRLIISSCLPKDLLQYHHELWHAPVGSILIQYEHGITDMNVLNAIRYHTTGKPHMSQLEMIVFIADYIEPARSFPGVNEVRNMVKRDLVYACWVALRNTIQFLMKKNQPVYPDTFHAYNDLTKRISNAY